jgi:hypothetical protein
MSQKRKEIKDTESENEGKLAAKELIIKDA